MLLNIELGGAMDGVLVFLVDLAFLTVKDYKLFFLKMLWEGEIVKNDATDECFQSRIRPCAPQGGGTRLDELFVSLL